jgi:DNA-binding MarR family transcriptional regulator
VRVAARRKHPEMLAVLEQFRILFKSIRRHYHNVERRAGISGAQLWALAEVAANPGVEVGHLARTLAIHQSTASNLLRRLQTQKLVSRQREGKDQRAVQLFATGKGLRVLKGAPKPLIGVLQQALSDLPRGSLRVLHSHLGKVIFAMKAKDLQARAIPLSLIE